MTSIGYPQSILLVLMFALSACRGSDAPTNETATTPPIELLNKIISLDDNYSINQGVELFLYQPNNEISNIKWRQTSGQAVSSLSNQSKVIAFTANQAGDYGFSVSFNRNGGIEQTLNKSIRIDEKTHGIAARLAHEVLSGNKVSLRVSLASNIEKSSIKWRQISGPTVTLTETNTEGKLAVFFNAPSVKQDTLISFIVTASDNSQTYADQVAVLVEPVNEINDNAYFNTRVAKVFSFNANSPYASNLAQCAYSNSLTSSCTLANLPLIANELRGSGTTPTIGSIMDRVLVSHEWMGQRFEQFLTHNDINDDVKNLLRATTAIVISYDIRPSFYWAATGAIYLDANNFWLTPDERDTINEAPDFRAEFGNDLQFVMPWRYVKNNSYANNYFSKTIRVSRSANDALYRLTSLMYHELAHANDYFPSNEWFIHDTSLRVLDAALGTNTESEQLSISFPLRSQTMKTLAQVSFAGVKANEIQRNYLPADIELFFTTDAATDFYAYSSDREDYALLFEELMMQSRFGVIRDVAITNQPLGSDISATDYRVTWGQRGRIADSKLKSRVQFSASRVLPSFDSNSAINTLKDPIPMIAGNNWIENLIISPDSQHKSKFNNDDLTNASNQIRSPLPHYSFLPYYQKALPKNKPANK